MSKKFKQMLASLLVIVLAFTSVPLTSFAANDISDNAVKTQQVLMLVDAINKTKNSTDYLLCYSMEELSIKTNWVKVYCADQLMMDGTGEFKADDGTSHRECTYEPNDNPNAYYQYYGNIKSYTKDAEGNFIKDENGNHIKESKESVINPNDCIAEASFFESENIEDFSNKITYFKFIDKGDGNSLIVLKLAQEDINTPNVHEGFLGDLGFNDDGGAYETTRSGTFGESFITAEINSDGMLNFITYQTPIHYEIEMCLESNIKGKTSVDFMETTAYTFCDKSELKNCEHEYEKTVNEATCVNIGYTINRCNKCSSCYYEFFDINDNHDYSNIVSKTDPTCTVDGEAVKICVLCGKTTVETLPATRHQNTVTINVKTATCTEEGYTGDTYCEDCKTVIATGKDTEKAPHTIVIDEAIAATCTETGLTEGSHCSVCNATITNQETVAMIPHTYMDTPIAPTCESIGFTKHTCTVCDYNFIDNIIDPTGHEDKDGDGYCDNCKMNLGTAECDCICHKTGLMGFIYKILRIFWKMFGINKTCCGGATIHY